LTAFNETAKKPPKPNAKNARLLQNANDQGFSIRVSFNRKNSNIYDAIQCNNNNKFNSNNLEFDHYLSRPRPRPPFRATARIGPTNRAINTVLCVRASSGVAVWILKTKHVELRS
jgi:hypothetical protein